MPRDEFVGAVLLRSRTFFPLSTNLPEQCASLSASTSGLSSGVLKYKSPNADVKLRSCSMKFKERGSGEPALSSPKSGDRTAGMTVLFSKASSLDSSTNENNNSERATKGKIKNDPQAGKNNMDEQLQELRTTLGRLVAQYRATAGVQVEVEDIAAIQEKARAEFPGILEGPVKAVTSPLMEGMAKASANDMPLQSDLASYLGQATAASVGDQLAQKLTPMITGGLPPMIPAVSAALIGQLLAEIPRRLGEHVPDAIVKDVMERVDTVVTTVAEKELPSRIEAGTATQFGLELVFPLLRTLSKSLTHSISMSLAATITHSASQDYLCYSCHKENKYCEYCHYVSTKVYYVGFYAGYYSTYIGNYYADYYHEYFARVFDDIEIPGEEDQHARSSDDNSDSIVVESPESNPWA